jgi:AcrR family transcriptional regulator
MARPADPNLRIELIAAAESVFSARGLDGARVEDITGRAGCSKGAFYQHFDSKEQLFLQIVETLIARLQLTIERRVVRASDHWTIDDLRQRWLERDVAVLEFVWQNREIVRLILEGGKSASSAHLMDAFAGRVRTVIAEFLEWGRAVGLCRVDLDVPITSLLVAGAYDRLARELVRLAERPDLVAWAQQNQSFILSGISDPLVTHPKPRRRS